MLVFLFGLIFIIGPTLFFLFTYSLWMHVFVSGFLCVGFFLGITDSTSGLFRWDSFYLQRKINNHTPKEHSFCLAKFWDLSICIWGWCPLSFCMLGIYWYDGVLWLYSVLSLSIAIVISLYSSEFFLFLFFPAVKYISKFFSQNIFHEIQRILLDFLFRSRLIERFHHRYLQKGQVLS